MPSTPAPSPLPRAPRWRRLGVALCLGSALICQPAWAGPIDHAGAGADTRATAGLASLSEDALAFLTLPSAAAEVGGATTLGIRLGAARGGIALQPRAASLDIPEAALDADIGGPWPRGWKPLPTGRLRPRVDGGAPEVAPHLLVGAGWQLPARITLAVALSLPVGSLQAQRSRYLDEREQAFSNGLSWTWAGDSQSRMDTLAVAAWRARPWLVVAAGAWMGQRVTSEAEVYITELDSAAASPTNVRTRVEPTFTPTVGLRVGPFRGLQLHLAWQGLRETGLETISSVRIRGLDVDGSDVRTEVTRLRLGQVPARLSAELAAAGARWAVALGGAWHRTSQLRTLHDGAVPGGLSDTVSLRAGARWRLATGWTLRAGGAWRPSPVPEQTGRTNLVDNDRVTGGVGLAWATDTPAGGLRLGLGLTVTRLLPRDHTKRPDAEDPVFDEWPDATDPQSGAPIPESAGLQTNNPGFPGYSSHAWLGHIALSATLRR